MSYMPRLSRRMRKEAPPPPGAPGAMSGTRSLTGGSAISLDGKSLLLPEDGGFSDDHDDLSSLNSSIYNGPRADIKILGRFEGSTPGLYTDNNDNDDIESEMESNFDIGTEDDAAIYHMELESASGGPPPAPPPDNDKETYPDYQDPLSPSEHYEGTAPKKTCLPLWIQQAPGWLKVVLGMGLALLIGAVVLVGVGLGLALGDDSSSTTQQENTNTGDVLVTFTAAPTEAPLVDVPPESGTTVSTGSPPTDMTGRAVVPTPEIVSAPSAAPVTELPSAAPSPLDLSITTFYVTGGRYPDDVLELVPDGLADLPTKQDTAFLVNVGDWNSPAQTQCVESSYFDVTALFSYSSVPVYFVPGDNEFNDCPDPEQALSYWREYLVDYETEYWDAPARWTVSRSPDYPENFSFAYNNILFVGINLPAGEVHDEDEFEERHEANLDFIDDSYEEHKREARVMVVFGHGAPEGDENPRFFEDFFKAVEKDYKQVDVVYVHRNMIGQSWGIEEEYDRTKNLSVVSVDAASWPPMQIQIDERGEVTIDQDQWYN